MVNIRILSTLFLFLSTTFILAQTKFESGYILDKSDKKINCIIKNNRWLSSPTQITYKLDENSDEIVVDPTIINGFQIKNGAFYKTQTANFPYYTDKVAQQNPNAEITTIRRTVFVKQLLNGHTSLFEYRLGNDKVYLYGIQKKPLIPLLYNEYLGDDNKIRSNNVFRNQLYKDVNCGGGLEIQKLTYTRRSLEDYFTKYNSCIEPLSKTDDDYKIINKKSKVSLKLWAGMQHYNFGVKIPDRIIRYKKLTPKFGLEVENVFPFNNNKWSLFLASQYTSHKAEGKSKPENGFEASGLIQKEFELTRIELFLGGRHYMFIGDNSSFFIEGGGSFDFDTKTMISGLGLSSSQFEAKNVNFALVIGLGYSLNQKLFTKVNYYFDQNILTFLGTYKNGLSRLSFSIGYKF